jgi:hypothetical protein
MLQRFLHPVGVPTIPHNSGVTFHHRQQKNALLETPPSTS